MVLHRFITQLMTRAYLLGGVFLAVFGVCAQGQPDSIHQKAEELAQRFIITDGHIDLPYRLGVRNFRLTKEFLGIPIESDEGDFDYVRAKAGGLDAPFMSIFIPSRFQKSGTAKAYADSLIDMIEAIAAEHPDHYSIASSPSEVEENHKQGIISLPMGMENGAAIGDDLSNVEYFHKRGIRYITLTHAKVNQICDSSYDTIRTWNGLSPFGEEVVREMNRVGIMVDVSHVSDSAFYDVMAASEAPVIASHSSCRKYTPGFERNMSDDMIRVLGENDGVIMINFGSDFLDNEITELRAELWDQLFTKFEEAGVTSKDPEAQPIIEAFEEDHPSLFSDVQKVADHIDHVVRIAGIDHVGLGSDFDGVGDSLPFGLKDVSQYPNLIMELLFRGYSEEDIEKICWLNLARVWRAVEVVSQRSK